MSDVSKQSDDHRSEDPGKQLGHKNANGGQSVGTGGHGITGYASNNQPVGGRHAPDSSQFSQKELHPGMNPDPAERGRKLGQDNARGGQSVGTGGHGAGGGHFGR